VKGEIDMTTITKTRKTRKPHRHAALTRMTHGKTLLWITKDGQTRGYTILQILTQIGGVAFRLGKAATGGCTEEYDVLIHGRETSCTCPGSTYRANQPCKHIAAIVADFAQFL
jgi:hypothetical protein